VIGTVKAYHIASKNGRQNTSIGRKAFLPPFNVMQIALSLFAPSLGKRRREQSLAQLETGRVYDHTRF
jgi:hypothetical protein